MCCLIKEKCFGFGKLVRGKHNTRNFTNTCEFIINEESMIIFFRYLTVENLSKMIASLSKQRSKQKLLRLKKIGDTVFRYS